MSHCLSWGLYCYKRHHDRSSYKGDYVVEGPCKQFQRLGPLSAQWGAWHLADRHEAEEGARVEKGRTPLI